MNKVVIAGNGAVGEAVRRQLKDEDTEVVSSFEELNRLVKDSLIEDKQPSIGEYMQEIHNSFKQLRFDTPAQNCKKNFKRKRFFNT